MAQYREMDDDGEDVEEIRPRRGGPRFGPLVTIALAILVLFGAVSRLGKPVDGDGLFSIDLSARTKLDQERETIEKERERTFLSIGAMPTSGSLRPRTMRSPIDPTAPAPSRGEFDLNAYRRDGQPAPMLAMPVRRDDALENYDRSGPFDPAPEAMPAPVSRAGVYTVKANDTWVKIAKATGKRWQDIEKANPESKGGLRAGMKLMLPEG